MAVNKKEKAKTAVHRDSDTENEYSTTESKILLQSVIDASLSAFGFLMPVLDNSGKIIDFECVFVNKKATEYVGGVDMAGKKLKFPVSRYQGNDSV